MGNTITNEEKQESKEIDRVIQSLSQKDYKKVVCLGTYETGKSTFIKQLKNKYYPEEKDIRYQIYTIIFSLIFEISKILVQNEDLKSLEKHRETITYLSTLKKVHFSSSLIEDIIELFDMYKIIEICQDPFFLECYQKERNNLSESADGFKFLLHDLERLHPDIYKQSTFQDYLYFYQKSNFYVQLESTDIHIKKTLYKFYQVVDQGYWYYIYRKTDYFLYFVALNDFEKYCGKLKRMKDNLNEYKKFITDTISLNAKIILIFTKYDEFIENIRDETKSVEELETIIKEFQELGGKKVIYSIISDFTDTECFEEVYNQISNVITNQKYKKQLYYLPKTLKEKKNYKFKMKTKCCVKIFDVYFHFN